MRELSEKFEGGGDLKRRVGIRKGEATEDRGHEGDPQPPFRAFRQLVGRGAGDPAGPYDRPGLRLLRREGQAIQVQP